MRTAISCYCTLTLFLIFSSNVFSTGLNEIPISDIVASQCDSIILIAAVGSGEDKVGSGFFVSYNGYIVTNGHIVQNARNLVVKLRDKTGYTKVRVVKLDARKDIAVLKIDGYDFKPVRLGNSDKLVVGQRVVAIGNPLGLESTVSDGLVSALRQTNGGIKLLQVSVPLSPGSSGGPLFNLQGEVVGITTASFLEGQNLNFAVPVNYLKGLLPHWIYRERNKSQYKTAETKNASTDKTPTPSLSDETKFFFYTVKPNDTLYSLSKRFNTTVRAIVELNKLPDEQIKNGQPLKIPKE